MGLDEIKFNPNKTTVFMKDQEEKTNKEIMKDLRRDMLAEIGTLSPLYFPLPLRECYKEYVSVKVENGEHIAVFVMDRVETMNNDDLFRLHREITNFKDKKENGW